MPPDTRFHIRLLNRPLELFVKGPDGLPVQAPDSSDPTANFDAWRIWSYSGTNVQPTDVSLGSGSAGRIQYCRNPPSAPRDLERPIAEELVWFAPGPNRRIHTRRDPSAPTRSAERPNPFRYSFVAGDFSSSPPLYGKACFAYQFCVASCGPETQQPGKARHRSKSPRLQPRLPGESLTFLTILLRVVAPGPLPQNSVAVVCSWMWLLVQWSPPPWMAAAWNPLE